jgi:membrane-associated phospholipid phosphatase
MPNFGTGLSGVFYQGMALLMRAGPLGELLVVLPVAGLLVCWCWVSGERRGAGAIAAVTTVTLIAVAALKFLSNSLGVFWGLHWNTVSNLFPSGHVAMATAVYGAMVICAARARPWLGFVIGMFTSAVLIGVALERDISGSHPILDVVGGAILGVAALIILVRIWPTGNLRISAFPAFVVAGGFVLVAFYGRSLPTSTWVEHTVNSLRSTVPLVLNRH